MAVVRGGGMRGGAWAGSLLVHAGVAGCLLIGRSPSIIAASVQPVVQVRMISAPTTRAITPPPTVVSESPPPADPPPMVSDAPPPAPPEKVEPITKAAPVPVKPIKPKKPTSPRKKLVSRPDPPVDVVPVVSSEPPAAAVVSPPRPGVAAAVPTTIPTPPEEPDHPPDVAAAYANNPAPDYPAAARRLGVEGVVTLRVTVLESGTVGVVGVAESSGSAVLDQAAQAAVRRWQFVPARRGDRPMTAEVLVPIRFQLQSEQKAWPR
ncbi:MAG: energy transducer TonB [Magnetococcales bacterium]|nr:energy transducer TonB [Magnetococcales bacterium]